MTGAETIIPISLENVFTMTWNSTMGLISTIALFLPVACILLLRLTVQKNFIALLLYFTSAFMFNLFKLGYINADPEFVRYWGIANNLTEAPLMLYFISYFRTSKRFSVNLTKLIGVFVLFECIVVGIYGLTTTTSLTIIMGPGLLLVAGFWLHFFVKLAKRAIEHKKFTGKAIISASLVFAYGCYLFIYLMFYIFKTHIENGVQRDDYVADTFLVYYIVSFLSSILLTAGIIIESNRVKKVNELKITREELSAIYTNTKAATPFRAAVLDFDKEALN
jgi:hypothetical protein